MFLLRRDSARTAEIEAVARYVDALLAGARGEPGPIESSFGALVRVLRAELRRHEPDPAFAANLRLRLIAAADQRAPAPLPLALWRQPRFIIGAAGVVSAAAILAYVARSRMQAAARAA
ncbi:MAG TPA: hypothetical protein VG370_33485 [Chloroflexota bacterium]|nr:hypothetical protein [Chloroflexota bacterium]